MVESQSRFSIIEELTNKKNSILREISTLKNNLENKKAQQVIRREDVERQLKREEEALKREEAQLELTISSKREEIKTLEEGLTAISEMSKRKEETQ